jgi:hypothetical protein
VAVCLPDQPRPSFVVTFHSPSRQESTWLTTLPRLSLFLISCVLGGPGLLPLHRLSRLIFTVLLVLLTEDDSVGSKALGAVRQLPTAVRLSEREGARMVRAFDLVIIWLFLRPEERHGFPSFGCHYYPNTTRARCFQNRIWYVSVARGSSPSSYLCSPRTVHLAGSHNPTTI